MIRIALAEDQAVVRDALAALLGLQDDLEIVACARNGRDALTMLEQHDADVLVTDVEMPDMDGLDLCAEAREQHPDLRIVVLTTFARSGYLRRAMQAGADAYQLKDSPTPSLVAAIRTVANGGKAIDPELAAEAWVEPDPLDERERDLLRRTGAGASTREIASELDVHPGTIRNRLSGAVKKLGVANRFEAVNVARAKGWL